MPVINIIKAHYRAYQEARKQEKAFQDFIRTVDEDCYAPTLNSPYEREFEKLINDLNPRLYDWYLWYVFEPSTFCINDTLYDATELSLDEFLEIVKND